MRSTMTNDGDLDIWALKWHDNGRPIEIYRYSGSVYKKNTLEYHKERSRSRIDIQYDKQ